MELSQEEAKIALIKIKSIFDNIESQREDYLVKDESIEDRIFEDAYHTRPSNLKTLVNEYASILREAAVLEYKERRRRKLFFANGDFAEPYWDILLDLFVHKIDGRLCNMTSCQIASCVPNTTALRWIRSMIKSGLIIHEDCPHDARVTYVSLSEDSFIQLARYFLERLASNTRIINAAALKRRLELATTT